MSKELGILAVVVLKAKNLHDRHSFYKQDPYTKVTLNGKTFKTDPDVKGGQHPEWDAEFRFPVYASKSDSSRQLEVSCWRAEPREDEEIGKGKVDISDTLKTGEFDDWVTINDVSGTYRGEVYLEMTFFASGPPPLERRPSKLPPQERLHHLKQGAVPTGGANLTVPGGIKVHGFNPQRMDKPLPTVHESQGPAPMPSILRPGSEFGAPNPNGPGRPPSGHTSPTSSYPPSSLAAGRPPAHRSDSNPFRNGQHTRISTTGGQGLPPSPHNGASPSNVSYSPPMQSKPGYNNPYVSNPAPPSMPGSGYFPSPQILVGHSPPEPGAFNVIPGGSGYSPPQHSPPQHSPPLHGPPQPSSPVIFTSAPSFPSVSPRPPSPKFHPPQQTSPPYPPPQSIYPPSQPGYPQPQSTYPPPSQQGYPLHAPPQFPSHAPTFPSHQGTYPTYDHASPPPGPGQRPFFARENSLGELPDPSLMHRYSSPLPLPHDGRMQRSNSPFPVPTVPPIVPPQHPVSGPFSPSAEHERQLQRKREQEERDAEMARRLDLELNLGFV